MLNIPPRSDYPITLDPTFNVIDSSKLDTYTSCPRKFFYTYVLGWQSERPNVHLIFGSALHKAIEIFKLDGYSLESIDKAMEAFKDIYYREFSPITDLERAPKNPQNAEVALTEYIAQYAIEDSDTEVLEVEKCYPVLINESRVLWGKVDSINRNSKGQVFTDDVKTSSRKDAWWYDQWELRFQFYTYLHILYSRYGFNEVKGLRVDGFIMRKKDNELLRHWVNKNPDQMEDWLWEVNEVYERLERDFLLLSRTKKEDKVMSAFPRHRNACISYMQLCPFHSICGAYRNPTQFEHLVPSGMQVKFWDPRVDEDGNSIEVKEG